MVIGCALGTAEASPRSDPTTGRAVFTGATMQSPTSIDLDPAAIGPGITDELYIGAMAVLDHYGVTLDHIDLATGALTPGPTVHDSELGPGGMIAYTWHLTEALTAGFELKSAPAEVFIKDRDPLAFHTLGGGQREYAFGIAGSYRIADYFYGGLGLSTITTTLHLHYLRDTALEHGHGPNGVDSDCGNGAPCGLQNPLAAETYDVDVRSPYFSTSNFVVNLGVLLILSKDMWFGIAYHSPPGLEVQTALTGSMDVERAPRDGGGVLHGASTVFLSQPASADAEFRMRTQGALDLHVGLRWEDLSRLQSYDVRGYGSAFPSAGIPEWTERARGLHDPFSLWAGFEQSPKGQWWYRFGARLGIETSSLEDDRTSPQSIAPRSYTTDVGIQFRSGPIVLQLSYGLQYFPTVNVGASAYDPRDRIACIESSYDYSTPACEAARGGYAIPTAAGTYDRIEQAFRVGLVYEKQ
jgi:hypothetical protein